MQRGKFDLERPDAREKTPSLEVTGEQPWFASTHEDFKKFKNRFDWADLFQFDDRPKSQNRLIKIRALF